MTVHLALSLDAFPVFSIIMPPSSPVTAGSNFRADGKGYRWEKSKKAGAYRRYRQRIFMFDVMMRLFPTKNRQVSLWGWEIILGMVLGKRQDL